MSEPPSDERASPLASQLALWVSFAMLVVVGVLTVLVPELQDAPVEDEDASESAS